MNRAEAEPRHYEYSPSQPAHRISKPISAFPLPWLKFLVKIYPGIRFCSLVRFLPELILNPHLATQTGWEEFNVRLIPWIMQQKGCQVCGSDERCCITHQFIAINIALQSQLHNCVSGSNNSHSNKP
jgi:hypothetical protein